LATLTIAALLRPAVSHAPADLAQVPLELNLDWFYLFVHPLQYATTPAALWAIAAAATVGLAALPAVNRRPRLPAAVVSKANCNGCGRCFADCPYAAVVLEPRADGKAGQRLATVLADLCAGCGVCAGACPSSTPFRSTDALVTGIDVPGRTIASVRTELERELAPPALPGRIVVFGCERGADLQAARDAGTTAISLYCTGMLPPSFIEYALRAGAAGVLITGCANGECEFRFGSRWTEERIARVRAPHLRANVPGPRVRIAWAGLGEEQTLRSELAQFRRSLASATAGTPQRARSAKRMSTRV
jgi:coenzyme F420-reducing hydrogenase delta subunit/ferredoxin